MPRLFDFEIASPVSVEQIHSAFLEQDYWLARVAEFGGGVGTLDSFDIDTDGFLTVVVRNGQVVHNEAWSPIDGAMMRGKISIAARGAPGSGSGAALVAPALNGSRLKFTGTVEVKVPLIGGKIETIISRQLPEQVSATQRFTAQWIAEHV